MELHICKNFNIPKFHSLIHYVSTVRSHGTLDGYNTESPEHLHIDFVKVPFRGGNKQDYTAQMATWMSHHDVVQRYETFLQWAKGEGIINSEEDSEDDNEDDAKPKRKQGQKDNVEVRLRGPASPASCSYKVAKIPGYRNVSMDTLVNKFSASDLVLDFIWYLEEFLLQHSLPIPSPALHNVSFGMFKHLSVMLPQIPQASDLTDLRDTIRTTLPEPSQACRKAVPVKNVTQRALE